MAFALDLTGTILDRRYRITGLLGKGGMGHVYEAVHVALDQRVAVKVLHPRYANEERFRERFLQEARAASRIRHPNVVEIKDFGDTPDGSVYFAMEYLGGHDVGVELQQHGALPWARTRRILVQATGALHAAHQSRIIHRDIKPGNCFLIDDAPAGAHDVVKLLDFGIAKVGSDSHADAQGKGLTGTGEVFGTASYMAPEQARGEVLDARSDMYSLGIMAYEMLTGEVPFTGVNAIHVITRHLNDQPEPLRRRVREIPAVVEALVLKMIAKRAADRYASMEDLERALLEIPEEAGVRRTRLWSSPGDLRALVEQKRAASAGVLPPGGAGTDAERTAVVVPAAGRRLGEAGAVDKRVSGAAASVAAGTKLGASPARGAAAASIVAPAARGSGVSAGVTMRPHAVFPGKAIGVVPPAGATTPTAKAPAAAPTFGPAATSAKPLLEVRVLGTAPAVRAPAAAPMLGAAAAPAKPPSPAPSPEITPTSPPVTTHSMGPASSPAPTPTTGLPPAAVALGFAFAPVATAPAPSMPAPAVVNRASLAVGERLQLPSNVQADGTNPPSGRSDRVGPTGSWASVMSSDGSHGRGEDTGSRISPQSLQPTLPSTTSWRLVALVALLVLVVGGVSVVGTMAFLSEQGARNDDIDAGDHEGSDGLTNRAATSSAKSVTEPR